MDININECFKDYELEIIPLTPTIIKSGKTLSPNTEFCIKNGKVFNIDTEKFLSAIAKDESKLLLFEDHVTNFSDKEKTNLLQKFIEKEMDCGIEEFIIPESAVEFASEESPVELATFIRTAGKPYIPGSSIKGALKTAILYWALTKGLYFDSKADENKKYKKGHELLSMYGTIPSFKYQNKIDELIFGKTFGSMHQPASLLRVSDSNSFSIKSLCISRLQKKFFNDNSAGGWSTTLYESLKPYTDEAITFYITIPQFELGTKAFKKGEELKYETKMFMSFVQSPDLKRLFRAVNHFSLSYISFEIDRVKGKTENSELIDSLDKIEDEIKSLRTGECILNLGFGKSFFRNTVAMAFKENCPNKFMEMLNKNYKDHEDKENFTSTYYLEEKSKDMLGWVKLSIKN